MLYLWVVIGGLVCIFQYSARAEGYYSFGKTVNKSFGDPNRKDVILTENIFVPITGKIIDIDLALKIEHTSVYDLQISLVSPGRTVACINSYDVYTFIPFQSNLYWTIFDTESSISINDGQAPFCGLFRPNGPDSLTSFYNKSSYGTWQIIIWDNVYGDTGFLKGVRLDFHINPEPSTLLLFLFSALICTCRQAN